MLLLEANKIEKSYGDRLLFRVEKVEVLDGDRIGIVGRNGTGKTTLLRILAQEDQPDAGEVRTFAKMAMIHQLEGEASESPSAKGIRTWGVKKVHAALSGGERNRLRIAAAMEKRAPLLLADEPTSHLDLPGIKQLEKAIQAYRGAIVLISHDRELLDAVCTQIWEVDDGKVTAYRGNYSSYCLQKEQLRNREWQEYEAYEKEKARLVEAAKEKKKQSERIRDTPKRMGNSEARLHKRSANTKRGKLDQSAKALESRLAQLEKKEKPREMPQVKFDLHYGDEFLGRTVVHCESATIQAGDRVLFSDLSFSVRPGQKVALIGANGTGKSTLLSMIYDRAHGFTLPQSAKIGYFHQMLNTLDPALSILENVQMSSRYPQALIQTALARLYFQREAVHKPVAMLSGGERVKVALAKVFLGDYNVLLLDEPTNYLDIPTQEELEQILADYPGTILFATHDRRLIHRLADAVLSLDEPEPFLFTGSFQEFLERMERRRNPRSGTNREEQQLLLETRVSKLISQLSAPKGELSEGEKERLEKEYQEALQELRKWKIEENS